MKGIKEMGITQHLTVSDNVPVSDSVNLRMINEGHYYLVKR